MPRILYSIFFPLFVLLAAQGCKSTKTVAADEPAFQSQLFEKGELIYSDNFDGELNTTRWMKRTDNWVIQDGRLIGVPDYKDKETAMKALKRDHHLGLSPVIRLDKLPKKFVVRMRLKYEGEFPQGQRSAKVDVGHHINNLNFTEEGFFDPQKGRQIGFEPFFSLSLSSAISHSNIALSAVAWLWSATVTHNQPSSTR